MGLSHELDQGNIFENYSFTCTALSRFNRFMDDKITQIISRAYVHVVHTFLSQGVSNLHVHCRVVSLKESESFSFTEKFYSVL